MALAHPGVLHEYAPRLVAYEFTSNTPTPKPNSLLFIGGLTDGLGTVPYVAALAKALETTDWSLFSLVLTSSYQGWGVGNLDLDVEEIGKCADYVRDLKGSRGKIVVMGHSTGSQDVLHYLSAPNPVARRPELLDDDRLMHGLRPVLDGAIMQAPMSDREMLLKEIRESDETRAAYDQLVEMARRQSPDEVLPVKLTSKVGFDARTALTAYRFLSLASPDSPENPADDDLFSSDLSDQRLRETFGVVAERGLLQGGLMALYSGNDEYGVPWVNKEALMERWKQATNAGGATWAETSAVIPGASHNVKDVGQDKLVELVLEYLGGL
ncbi:hypothetical protein FE257_006852 [Aspergillus nanangensis]|uniref:Dolichol-phosphate mannosyltransferase n=1 Tax=Aspergillus nanangensis TaxID=2582783 RepID=A0AAD4GVZ1_ASPNN|nr:hypothetical protein FE257_006852 [Aspergillus nanangensis]